MARKYQGRQSIKLFTIHNKQLKYNKFARLFYHQDVINKQVN